MSSSKKYIVTGEGLPLCPSPISQAVVVNNMCFISGQLSTNVAGEYICGLVLDEAKLAFSNFFSVLINAGFEKSDIVFIDIAFDDLNNLPDINQLYLELFPENKRPARTIYQAAALPYGGKIKVTGTAVRELP